VHIHASSVRGRPPFRLGLLRVEVVQGCCAEPIGLRGPDLVGDRGQVPVHVRGSLGGQGDGVFGDPAGPPERQPPGGHQFPEPGSR
jgi:hypothetical protein